MIKPGKKLVIVENDMGKLSTPSAISFTDSGRLFGEKAVKEQIKRPKATILDSKRLFSVSINNTKAIDHFKNTYQSLNLFEDDVRKDTNYKILNHNLTSEEPVIMILEHAKKIAENYAEGPIKDCVITVPSFWTRNQRLNMIYASYSVGFNLLSLINENTAAAIYYSFDRTDKKDFNVLFYNLGASFLQVSIAKYSTKIINEKLVESVDILSHTSDLYIGGSLIDRLITETLVNEFEDDNNIDLRDSEKSMLKLYQQAESAKKALTLTRSTVLTVDSLIDSKELKSTINRDAIDKLLSPYADRFIMPITQALDQAGILIDEINSFELIGGASRNPNVQEILKFRIQKELSTHLNADEAIAQGAAFFGANYSMNYQLKPVQISDIITFDLKAKFYSLYDTEFYEEAEVFTKKTKLGSMQKVQFTTEDDIKVILEAKYNDRVVDITSYVVQISDVAKSLNTPLSILFGFVVDLNGLPFLFESYAQFDLKTNENLERKSIKLNQTEYELETPKTLKLQDVRTIMSKLYEYNQKETEIQNLEKAKSELESAIYLVKEKLNDENFNLVITTTEKEYYHNFIQDIEKSLETPELVSSNSTEISKITAKINEYLKEAFDRENEFVNRKDVIVNAFEQLDKFEEKVISLKATHLWISDNEFEALWNSIEETKAWLNINIKQQSLVKPYETPSFKMSDILLKIAEINKQIEKVKNISSKKPKEFANLGINIEDLNYDL